LSPKILSELFLGKTHYLTRIQRTIFIYNLSFLFFFHCILCITYFCLYSFILELPCHKHNLLCLLSAFCSFCDLRDFWHPLQAEKLKISFLTSIIRINTFTSMTLVYVKQNQQFFVSDYFRREWIRINLINKISSVF